MHWIGDEDAEWVAPILQQGHRLDKAGGERETHRLG